ncbi:MAG: ferritin [Erysipelotrichaceae bacterium]
MLKTEIVSALQEQLNQEFYSAYLYLSISAHFDRKNFRGLAHWFRIQAMEERDHAMLIFDYLLENGEEVQLKNIADPQGHFETLVEPIHVALEHEYFITASINNIYAIAMDLKDFRTINFLNWLVTEQMEEEKNAQQLVDTFKMLETDPKGLYVFDQGLLSRVYTPVTLATI